MTGEIRKNVILDSFFMMPNHLYGIVIIIEIDNGSRGMARHATRQHYPLILSYCP